MKKLLILNVILSLTFLASAHANTVTCKTVTLSTPVPGVNYLSLQFTPEIGVYKGYSYFAKVNVRGAVQSFSGKIGFANSTVLVKSDEIASTGLCKNRGKVQFIIYEGWGPGSSKCLQDCSI